MDDGERLDAIADALFALPPDAFTAARDSRAKELRGSDRNLAAAVRGLRRPTVSAWLVDLLVRERRPEVDALLELGADLRLAQETLQGDALRELTTRRRAVVGALVRSAVATGRDRGVRVTGDAENEVTATLEAALADPDVAERVRAGRLDRPVAYAGLGPVGPFAPVRSVPAAPGRTAVAAVEQDEADTAEERRREQERQAEIAAAETAALVASGDADDAQREHDRVAAAAARASEAAAAATAGYERAREALVEAQRRAREADEVRIEAKEAARQAEDSRLAAERVARDAHRAADEARARLHRLRGPDA